MLRWLWLVTLLAGCPFYAAAPKARVFKGPAASELETLAPIAAFPPVCKDIGQYCPRGQEVAVMMATRTEIEYLGLHVVDTELLNAETQRRDTKANETVEHRPRPPIAPNEPRFGEPHPDPENVQVTGRTFVDLSAEDQVEMLRTIGVKGALRTTITFGIPRGMASQQTITVTIEMTRLEDGAVAWWSACSAESGDQSSSERALELATRCALESTSLW